MLVMRSEKLSDSSCYVVDRRGDEKRCNRHRGYLSRGNDVCVVVIRQISIEDNFRDKYGCYNENPCNYLAENSFTHQVLLLAADPPHRLSVCMSLEEGAADSLLCRSAAEVIARHVYVE